MKQADYRLPFGVVDALEPIQTGTTPDTKAKDGSVVKGKPTYDYRVVKTREAENLAEFQSELVDQTDAVGNVLTLAQGAWDIIAQRKVREFCSSVDAQNMIDGKTDDTKGLSEDERVEAVLIAAQEIADAYRYGSRGPSTGGATAAGKKALEKEKAIANAAASNPELAAKLAALDAELKALGISV